MSTEWSRKNEHEAREPLTSEFIRGASNTCAVNYSEPLSADIESDEPLSPKATINWGLVAVTLLCLAFWTTVIAGAIKLL